jgi:hypothetical protein
MSTEGAPTASAVARVAVLDRELGDVEKSFDALTASDLPALNEKLKAKSLAPLTIADATDPPDAEAARGGPVDALFAGTVGSRHRGTLSAAHARESDDR